VLSVLRQSRGGRNYDSTFGKRMRGEGVFADMLSRRYHLAKQGLGLGGSSTELDCTRFTRLRLDGQLDLF
jgi:hypothetical protein